MSPFEKANARLAEREQQRRAARHVFPEGCTSLKQSLEHYEAEIVTRALALKKGKLFDTATLLGISYQGLRYILDTRQKGIAGMATPKRKRPRVNKD